MKKQLLHIALLATLLAAGTLEARAQVAVDIDIAPHLGYGLAVPNQVADRGSISVGAQGHFVFALQDRLSLILNPMFDYFLTRPDEDVTAFQLDGNALLGIGSIETHLNPYAGVGVAFTRVSGSDDFAQLDEGSDIGFNLILGSAFGAGNVRTFFQGRWTLTKHNLYINDEEEHSRGFSVQGGLMFRL